MTESPPLPRRPADEQPVEYRRALGATTGDMTIVAFEWAGDGPPILLAHGTSFHARVWDEVARRLPGRRVIALDLRGHGRSGKPDGTEPYRWVRFGDDIAAFVEALDLRRVVGVGHSMGGYAMADGARRDLDRFGALVLVDPTISRPGARPERPAGALDFVSRRRNEWASPEEMLERFTGRFPFNDWDPAILRDYAVHGLLPAAAGDGYVLACPPAVEAAVYAGRESPGPGVVDELDRYMLPVRVLRAKLPVPGETAAPFTVSPTMPDLAARLPDGIDVPLPHLSHFIPMEAPDLVARQIIAAADAVS